MSNEALLPPPPPPTYIFHEHKAEVNHVHLFDSDNYAASCDFDGWIAVWKMRSRRPVLKWKAHEQNCLKVTTTSDSKTLISQGRDGRIHFWKLNLLQQNQATVEKVNTIIYNDLCFCKMSVYSDEESTLVCFPSVQDHAYFDVFDVTRQKRIIQNVGEKKDLNLGGCMVVELYKQLDNLFVLAGYENGSTGLWDIHRNELVWHNKDRQEPVLGLSIDLTASYFISSSADNQICKYSITTGDVIKKITIKKSGVPVVRIRSDNKIFATGGYDGRIRVFSARSMKPLAVLCYHRDSIYSIDFGAHGNWLMAASKDRRISLWNLF